MDDQECVSRGEKEELFLFLVRDDMLRMYQQFTVLSCLLSLPFLTSMLVIKEYY